MTTVTEVTTRTALAALTPSAGDSAYLTESGREGLFVFDGSNLASRVFADTAQGVYVAPSSDTTGASGAWTRRGESRPAHFGAVADGVTDDIAALQAFWNMVIGYDLLHDCSGTYAISAALTIGPGSPPATSPGLPLVGRVRLTALSAINEIVRLKNLSYRSAQGLSLDINGIGSTSFSSRTCLIGIYVENCARFDLGDVITKKLALAGMWFGTSNNNMMKVASLVADSIGSGRSGQSLTANWTTPVNSGSSGSTSQSTQITVDALPSATIQTYETIGSGQLQVRIAGYLYYVNSIVGSNVTIYPWLDNTSFSAGSGTVEWVFGGAFCTRTTDSNLIEVGLLDASNCSRTLSDAALYGSKIRNMQSNGVGTEICLGKGVSSACFGTKVIERYVEGGGAAPHEQIVSISLFGSSSYHQILGDAGAPDLSKCWALGDPRATAGQIVGGEFGVKASGSITVTRYGRFLQHLKNNLVRGPGSSITLYGQTRPPLPEVYSRDSHNLTLAANGSGEYNRLFGYSGGIVGYIGTGTNGAPTGSFVFTPPSGGTINGGAVNATATFSGFEGPVWFSYEHTDTAQLIWLVRPLTGRSRQGLAGTSVKGDAAVTLTPYTDKITQRFTTTLTANRAVTLATAGAVEGNRFKITRPATGAFNLNVGSGPLKALAAGQWCEVEYDGAAWQLIAYGSL